MMWSGFPGLQKWALESFRSLDAEYYCWESDFIVSAGVLGMLSETCLHNRKRIATFVVYICTLLMQMTLLKGISLG